MAGDTKFHILDVVIFSATIIISLTIGLTLAFRSRKSFSSKDYFFGGRKQSFLPVALSFVVTFQSSLMILGFPAEVYGYGMTFSLILIGIMVAFGIGATVAVPIFRPLEITSIYKYFYLRFGSNEVRFVAASAGIIYLVFYMATIILGTSVALNSVMGIPYWSTMIVCTLITALYTSLGGFRAVIWTDVFQLLVMLTGIFATLIKSTLASGGTEALHIYASNRMEIEFSPDPTLRLTLWSCIFGSVTQNLIIIFSQAGLQRINATPTNKSAYIMFAISAPLYVGFMLLCLFEGLSIFTYYSSIGCDPVASGRISNINEILPTAVLDLFGHMPGLAGLFIASLSSAVLSTLSSCLNGLSSVTFEDIIKLRHPNMSDQRATRYSKVVVFLYGGLSRGIAFLMTLLSGPVSAIFQSFAGSLDGPSCAVFILSIFFLRSTPKGIIIGALSGMVVSMVFNLGQIFLPVPSNQYLPLGPTDRCLASISSNYSDSVTNVSYSLSPNEVLIPQFVTPTSGVHDVSVYNGIATTSTEDVDDASEASALLKVFGMSYMLYSLTGFLITIIVGAVASIFTTPSKAEVIDYRCLYPLPDWLCSVLPNGWFYSRKEKESLELDKFSPEESKPLNDNMKMQL